MAPARATTTIDDDRVRVTVWTFDGDGDGDETGQHEHQYDYVVVPVTGGSFTVVGPDGAVSRRTQEAGVPYRGAAGTRHNVVNAGGVPATFVELELK